MVERRDHGDEVIAHEFDFSIKNQARRCIDGRHRAGTEQAQGRLKCCGAAYYY